MNRLTTYLLSLGLSAGLCVAQAEDTSVPSMAYGIRVYSTETGNSQKLVSFPVDNPSDESEMYDLSGYKIVAATCHDNIYYLIHSDDGVLATKFLTLDLNTGKIQLVKTWDWKADVAGNIIYADLTYDEYSGRLYAAGYDLNDFDIDGDDIVAQFGLFTIDPASGNASLIGSQNDHALVAITTDAEGTLMGVDERGVLWDVASYNGLLNYEMLEFGVSPVSLQSMAHDYGKSVSYYASYTSGEDGQGVSELIKFWRTPYYTYEFAPVGPIGVDSEIIGLYIDSNPLPKGAPSVVEDFTVTPGEEGLAQATLQWINPSRTVGGDDLSKVDVVIYRDDEAIKTLQGLDGGASQSWIDSEVAIGNHVYSIAAVTEVSEGRRVYFDEKWIGEDTPGAPAVTALKGEGNSISISWTAPETGLYGGWYDAGDVVYTVVRKPDSKIILENSTSLSLTDSDFEEMHGYYYEVTASTAAGKGGTGQSAPIVVGNPHTVPFIADFNDNDQLNQWSVFNLDGDEYGWYSHTTGWAGTYDVFMRYNPENILNPETSTDDWLISPPVALESGKLYVAKYDLRLLGTLFPANTTFAMGEGSTPQDLTIELNRTDGEINDIEWVTHPVPFTVDSDGGYSFGLQVRNAVPVQFYKFAVEEVQAVDMTAGALRGNTIANVGVKSEFTVEVTNKGFYTVDKYTVNLVDNDGNVVASEEIDEPLGSQMSTTVNVSWIPATEGVCRVRPAVCVDGDADAENDFGSELDVTVFGTGEMHHITDGTTGSGYAPIYGSFLHSAVQTIYPADMMGGLSNVNIKAMVYYIYMASGQDVNKVNFEVALANVDKDDFSDKTMVSEDKLTKVFDGELAIDPKSKMVAILFDTPFTYTGGNLCVFTRHSSDKSVSVYFKVRYVSADPLYTCLYRGSEPFDFTQEPNGSYRDLPNVSFLMENTSGVEATVSQGEVKVGYSRETGKIVIDGAYDRCRVYSVTGTLLGEYEGLSEITVASSAAGEILIVEVVSGTDCVVKKIAR